MKTTRIQAAFARRRETEHARIEKTEAVNRYFDHWGKVTSRFESWTTPEYYQHAQASFEKEQEKKMKDQQLEDRREKLKSLLEYENNELQEELRQLRKPKPRRVSTDILEKIDKNLKCMEEDKRRIDLESKLYGRWRHGRTPESALFDSKSDHEAMAKLNWLDKQIEGHMQREKDQKDQEERILRYQEETRKRDEYLQEERKIRESEIKQLKELQTKHIQELRSRENDGNNLYDQEEKYKNQIEQLHNQLESITARKQILIGNPIIPHNIKKIKMYIRKRSDHVRDDLRDDIKALQAIPAETSDEMQTIRHLIEKFEMQYDLEIQKQTQIEAMYESETKHNLFKWEDQWTKEAKIRESQIFNILGKQKTFIQEKLSENIKQQKHFMEVREAHLVAIENSNEKLKLLIKEQENFQSESTQTSCTLSTISSPITCVSTCAGGFRKIGTPSEEDREACIVDKLSSQCEINKNQTVSNFGRKKVAWT